MPRHIKIASLLLTLALLSSALPVLAFTAGPGLTAAARTRTSPAVVLYLGSPTAYVYNQRMPIDSANPAVTPVLRQARTLVPVRFIAERLGAYVEWHEKTATVTATLQGRTVRLAIGSQTMTVNGAAVTIDVPAAIINTRTYLPLRAVAEAFGQNVQYERDLILISPRQMLNPATDRALTGEIIRWFGTPPTDLTAAAAATLRQSVLTCVALDEAGEPFAIGQAFAVGEGLFLTALTNLQWAKTAVLLDADGTEYPVSGVVRYDPASSLALIRTAAPTGHAPLPLAAAGQVAPGTPVYSLDNAEEWDFGQAAGTVSAVETEDGQVAMTITAPVDPAGLGLPIVNRQGIVVGVGVFSSGDGTLQVAISPAPVQAWLSEYVLTDPSQVPDAPLASYLIDPSVPEAEIVNMIGQYYQSIEDENIEAFRYHNHLERPDLDEVTQAALELFADYNIDISVESIDFYERSAEQARAKVIYTLRDLDDPDGEAIRIVALLYLQPMVGFWKVFFDIEVTAE